MERWRGLTGIGREQGAALAVYDLLDDRHILGDGRRHDAQARHHGVHGSDARHHAQARVEVCRRARMRQKQTQNETLAERTTNKHTMQPQCGCAPFGLWIQIEALFVLFF